MQLQKKIIFFTIWIFISSLISFLIYKLGIYDPLSDIARQAYFHITHQRESRVQRYIFIYALHDLLFFWVIYNIANIELLQEDKEEFPEFDYSSYYFFYGVFIFLTCGFVYLFTATIILISAASGLPHEISLAFFLKRIDSYFFDASFIAFLVLIISFFLPKSEKN